MYRCVSGQNEQWLTTVVFLPVLSVLPFILTVLVAITLSISVIVSVVSSSSQDTSSIDKVEDDTQQDKGAQQGQAGSSA